MTERKEYQPLQPTVIIWRDSRIYYGQTSSDDRYDVETIKTCGYWLGWSKNGAIIARDLVGDEHRGVIVIPTENIISVNPLRSV